MVVNTENTYDAIIIGAGHNGLVCANYLARKGLKVVVFERREVIGGAAVTEELWPGIKASTASYVCSLLDKQIINDLDLYKHGFVFLAKEPQSFSPMLNGEHFFIYGDALRTKKEIARFSRKDAKAYDNYDKYLAGLVESINPILKQSPPDINNMFSLAKFGIKNMNLVSKIEDFVDIMSLSAKDLLDRWFESEEVKASFATDGIVGTFASPQTPGTAYVLLHHVMGNIKGRGIWGYIQGGMGGVSLALARSAEAYNVKIMTGMPIEKIIIENGKAVGVKTSKNVYRSKIIISNADPKRTFLNFVGEEHLDDTLRAKIKNYQMRASSFKINMLLDGLPNFECYPNKTETPGPQHTGTIYICEGFDYMERAFDDAKYGMPSRKPVIEISIPSSMDKTLAPKGMYVAGCFVQYAPYKLKGTDWNKEREKFVKNAISIIRKYAPNIDDIIVKTQGLSPIDLESRFGLTGGNIFHGDMTPNQLFFSRFSYKTPIKNLYLCGSGTHPGGGVSGLPGFNAAKTILEDKHIF